MGMYKLCLGCMEEKGQLSVCPHCGYIEGQSHDKSHLKPGTVLNERYLIGKAANKTSEGITYVAYDKVIGCRVDIKEYMPGALCERMENSEKINVAQKDLVQYKTYMSEFTELYKKLARMRTLSHISPPLDIFAQNNTTYVVFEHIEGMTLVSYLKENAGELTWDQVKKIFPPLFTTLSLVHNAGIIHRGISPETLYYTTDGEIKLTGFSIAAARTLSSELKGDLYTGYAAPEQYNISDWQGPWTDVYGVCAVLYRILTGCMPVEATSRVVNDNLIEAHDINPSVPKNVSKTIVDGMRLLSDARIQDMTDLVTRLFEEPQQPAVAAVPPVRKTEPTVARTAPKSTAPARTTEAQTTTKKTAAKEPQKTTLFEQIKVPILISCLLLAIIIIIVVLFLPLVEDLDSNNNSTSSHSDSYSDSDASVIDITTPAVTTVTTTTTTTASTVTPTELYTLRNLVGEEYDLVATSATSKYVKFVVIEEYSDTIAKGLIIDQSVPADEAIPKGSEVELTVSMGPAVVDLPDYTGVSGTAYQNTLIEMGVKEENITISEYKNENGATAGHVAFTSLDEQGKINLEEGEQITVYIFEVAETTAPSETAPAADAAPGGETTSTADTAAGEGASAEG